MINSDPLRDIHLTVWIVPQDAISLAGDAWFYLNILKAYEGRQKNGAPNLCMDSMVERDLGQRWEKKGVAWRPVMHTRCDVCRRQWQSPWYAWYYGSLQCAVNTEEAGIWARVWEERLETFGRSQCHAGGSPGSRTGRGLDAYWVFSKCTAILWLIYVI